MGFVGATADDSARKAHPQKDRRLADAPFTEEAHLEPALHVFALSRLARIGRRWERTNRVEASRESFESFDLDFVPPFSVACAMKRFYELLPKDIASKVWHPSSP